VLCFNLLELVVDFALERYPAFADRHGHLAFWNSSIPLEGIDYSSSNIGIGTLIRLWQAHFYIIGYCSDTTNAVSGFLGSDLFQIRIKPSRLG
jgi:hypothetical protein